MTGPVSIRPMTAADWPAVEAIYRAGIDTGNATFESEPPTWENFNNGKLNVGRWVAASPVSTREVYRGVVEHSVYDSPSAAGRGVGRLLLDAFIAAAGNAGIWTIQSSIFPENAASLALHDRVGFRRIGIRERIALMTHGPWVGQWRDTILIERRSQGEARTG